MNNAYFGVAWSAPLLDDMTQVETPVGQPCLWCEEQIEEGDQGLIMGAIDAAGKAQPQPIHRECNVRMSLGSVAHLERRCSCYVKGSTEEDPPDMTKRQAAQLAEATAYRVYSAAGGGPR